VGEAVAADDPFKQVLLILVQFPLEALGQLTELPLDGIDVHPFDKVRFPDSDLELQVKNRGIRDFTRSVGAMKIELLLFERGKGRWMTSNSASAASVKNSGRVTSLIDFTRLSELFPNFITARTFKK
jgi:hypothetical protein